MKLKRFLAISTAAAIAMSLAVSAAPYKDHVIGTGTTTIECEDYDGGEDNYWDSNPADGNHDYRADEHPQTGGGSRVSGEGYNVGWTAGGEWIQYTVNVEKSGTYEFKLWTGSGSDHECPVDISANGTKIGTAMSPTIGWDSFELINVGTIDLSAGTNVIRIDMPEGGVNLDAMEITALSVSEEAAAPAAKESPKTGVSSSVLPVIALVMSGAALVVLKRKEAVR